MSHESAGGFDHRRPGTSPAVWAPVIAAAPPLDAPGADDHLLVLVAHPDDESLGAGGLIATASGSGARITVVIATDGEASHPDSGTHSASRLAELRRREVEAAVAALAPRAELRQLGLPDGRLADHVSALLAAIEDVDRPTHIVTTWIADGHADHAACAQAGATLAAATQVQHWQFPIWAWRLGRPDGPAGERMIEAHRFVGLRLDDRAWSAKKAALACYRSQHQPLSAQPGDEPILDDDMLGHFRGAIEPFLVPAVSKSYFTSLYADAADPWQLAERFYERRKRGIVLAALPRERFRRAFEPGCATGLLTEQLARRCDEVVACDIAAAAIERTAARLASQPHVTVTGGAITQDWPDGTFDLIVLSEVGYYCDDLQALVTRVEASLSGDGVLVACHWRHPAPLHRQSAERVHAVLDDAFTKVVAHAEEDFLLDVWSRVGRSVATAEGIVQ